jgi:hypothetical protein
MLTKTLEKTGITSSITKTDFEDVDTGVLLASRYVKVVGMNTSTRKLAYISYIRIEKMVPTHVSREGNQFPARTCS